VYVRVHQHNGKLAMDGSVSGPQAVTREPCDLLNGDCLTDIDCLAVSPCQMSVVNSVNHRVKTGFVA